MFSCRSCGLGEFAATDSAYSQCMREGPAVEHTFTYSEYLECMQGGPAVENTPSPTVPTYNACEKGQQRRLHLHLQCLLTVQCMREGPAAETTPSPTVPTYSACEEGQQWRPHLHLQCQPTDSTVHARRALDQHDELAPGEVLAGEKTCLKTEKDQQCELSSGSYNMSLCHSCPPSSLSRPRLLVTRRASSPPGQNGQVH